MGKKASVNRYIKQGNSKSNTRAYVRRPMPASITDAFTHHTSTLSIVATCYSTAPTYGKADFSTVHVTFRSRCVHFFLSALPCMYHCSYIS